MFKGRPPRMLGVGGLGTVTSKVLANSVLSDIPPPHPPPPKNFFKPTISSKTEVSLY